MSNTKTNLSAVSPALPHEVRIALSTIAEYIDTSTAIGPAASAVELARSRLAGVITSLNGTLA